MRHALRKPFPKHIRERLSCLNFGRHSGNVLCVRRTDSGRDRNMTNRTHFEIDCQDDASHGRHVANFSHVNQYDQRIYIAVCDGYEEKYTEDVVIEVPDFEATLTVRQTVVYFRSTELYDAQQVTDVYDRRGRAMGMGDFQVDGFHIHAIDLRTAKRIAKKLPPVLDLTQR